MGLMDKVLDSIGLAKKAPIKVEEKKPANLPPPPAKDPEVTPKSGRSSVDPSTSIASFVASYDSKQEFPVKMLQSLIKLAIYNGDFSLAVDNIKQLGATKFKVYMPDTMNDATKSIFLNELNEQWSKWYPGGATALVGDLTVQLAIFGALSAEAVPNKFLDGFTKIVTVDVPDIRFKYDKAKDLHEPYQKVDGVLPALTEGMVKLNTLTYRYQALTRFSSSPYGIPPLLSALESMAIDKDMMNNFKTIIKKLGFLGFLNVLVAQPSQTEGEDDTSYSQRLNTYLKDTAAQVDKSLANGYVVGFKDSHEFEMQSSSADADGSQKIFEMNETRKMAGLKQDPMMLGRNQSTTEALAKVIITKLANQVGGYQAPIEEVLGYFIQLYASLRGYKVEGQVKVELDKSLLSDKLKDAQARAVEIANADALYNNGTISQEQRATELGYEAPAEAEPRPPIIDPNKVPPIGKGQSEPTNKGSKVSAAFIYLGGSVKQFEYGTAPELRENYFFNKYVMAYRDSASTDLLAEKIVEYYNATTDNYYRATAEVTELIAAEISNLPASATAQEVVDSVVSTLYSSWGKVFIASQRSIISQFITSAYKAFRQDTSPFGGATIKVDGKDTGIPEATFTLLDERAIAYYKASDSLYLGKFITDKDIKKSITAYIKEKYLGENTAIGQNKKAMAEFRREFPELLNTEDWKISRIINTTVNKMRNNAAVSYMKQAGFKTYEVVEANDKITCAWCRSMHGRTFSVDESIRQADSLYSSSPSEVSAISPFINSVYRSADELVGVDNATLQARGISVPAYHPDCRGTIVAKE